LSWRYKRGGELELVGILRAGSVGEDDGAGDGAELKSTKALLRAAVLTLGRKVDCVAVEVGADAPNSADERGVAACWLLSRLRV